MVSDKLKTAILAALDCWESIRVVFPSGATIGYNGWTKKPYYAMRTRGCTEHFATADQAWAWIESDLTEID